MNEETPIIKITSRDVDKLYGLWDRAGLSYRPRGRDERSRLQKVIDQGLETFLGIYENNRLIGVILATHDGRKGWLNRLAVDPDYRGQGLGRRLIRQAEDFIHRQGIEIIAVLIEPDNPVSLSLFQKCGYIPFEGMSYLTKRQRPDV